MKTIIATISLLILNVTASFACTVCKSQQPKFLQGITHGAGPDSNWDYLIVATMVAVVAGTLILSVRHLIRPSENANHIKYTILNSETHG